MTELDLYPSAPVGVPANYTKPTGSYRLRAIAVLGGLFLFLLFYLALIAGIAFAGYLLATNPPPLPKGRGVIMVLIAYVGGLIAILMLLLFLVKGLFKRTKTDRSTYLKLKRSEQPHLFEFIDRVCMETAAPKPSGVYVSPDVNAAVFYDTSLLNLIIPPRKYLLIGAGLVNSVNLREFKAVLAHEFGHFSQKSLAIGSYVWVANKVLGDMIYARDSWDDALRQWCSFDIRLSFPAWGLRGVVWLLRAMLGGAFKGINLLNLSLSRQMEFNADDVAVSVAGSDAIVTTLCRAEFADRCFAVAARDLMTAADHDLYSKDIFHHQSASAAFVRAESKQPQAGIPPTPPARVFNPDDASHGPAMWSSHPANHDREENAKRVYFPVPADERSPWLLFQNPKEIKFALAHVFYKHMLDRPKPGNYVPPEQVQSFIEAERAETQYDPKYHGLYDDRALKFPDLPNVAESDSRPDAVDRLAAFFNQYPSADLETSMAEHHKRRQEAAMMIGLQSGELGLKGRTFPFRGRDVSLADVPKLLKKIGGEIDEDHERFGEWDREMYLHHYQAAHRLDPERAIDLRRRYVFLKSVQEWVMALNRQESELTAVLTSAQGRELQPEQFRELVGTLQVATDCLWQCLRDSKSVVCPEMSNVADGTKLHDLIKDEKRKLPRFDEEGGVRGEDVGQLMNAYHQTLMRLRRVFFKGLGNILSRQEQIAADFRTAFPRPAR